MANEEHLKILRRGVEVWNEWRQQNASIKPDLQGANLSDKVLDGISLSNVSLSGANLRDSSLNGATLFSAEMQNANLSNAILSNALLPGAILTEATLIQTDFNNADLLNSILINANLSGADLARADLTMANLCGVNFNSVRMGLTILHDTNLSDAMNLDTVRHSWPSVIDHQTVFRSGRLPEVFLRGCGLPDSLINYLPSLLNDPVQFYSCFISPTSAAKLFLR